MGRNMQTINEQAILYILCAYSPLAAVIQGMSIEQQGGLHSKGRMRKEKSKEVRSGDA